MSEPPRRRRTTPPPQRQPKSSSSVLPTIALGVGVVVAGLGIGAFLSAMQHKDVTATTTAATAAPTGLVQVTPVARPPRGPVAIATIVAHPTATPTPAATPKPSATPRATATPSATATPAAASAATPSSAPSAMVSPRPAASPRIGAETRAPATPAPVVVTPRAATPRAAATPRLATPRPTERPTAVPATPVPRATPLTFAGIAQNTVRRYIADLVAGNENAAYAELGKAPGEGGAALSEEAFVDRGTRITSIRTTSTDANGATVEVELLSARGSYFATYHVTNGPSGPVIDQHDYIKV